MQNSTPGSGPHPRMAWPVLCLGLVLAGCSGYGGGDAETAAATPPGSTSEDLDDRGVIGAHKQLIEAMEAGDTASVTALMDPSADLLIFHPFVENRFDGIRAVDSGLGRMFEQMKDVSWTEAHAAIAMEGNVAWLTSHVLIKSPTLPSAFVGRGTEIWVRRPGGWRLNHAHWSENAELAGSIREEN